VLPLEQYVATSFEGVDREYVAGEVIERAVPNGYHGILQQFCSQLAAWNHPD